MRTFKKILLTLSIFLMLPVAQAFSGAPVVIVNQERTDSLDIIGSKIATIAYPYTYQIAEGNVTDHVAYVFTGANDAIGTTPEFVWNGAGPDQYPYLTAGEILQVKSTDVNDTAAGTGARTVQIYGCTDAFVWQDEIITLNGTTAVPTTKTYYRIWKAIVRTAGTGGKNAGDILVNDNADAVRLGFAIAGENHSGSAHVTVAAGTRYFITSLQGNGAGTKNVHVHFYVRPVSEVFQLRFHVTLNDSPFSQPLEFPAPFEAGTDIEVKAHGDVAGGLCDVVISGWYEDS